MNPAKIHKKEECGSFENSMILPAALSGRFLFLMSWCGERCSMSLCFSRGPWLEGVVFGPVLLSWMGIVFGTLLDIWKLLLCLLWLVQQQCDNNQNYQLRSGIRNLLSSANQSLSVSMDIAVWTCTFPRSHFRRETRPVFLRDEKRQSVFLWCYQADAWFLVLERQNVFLWCYHVNSLFFLSCKTVEHRSRKSRDLLQRGEFTVSFQCSCMRTVHVCSFVSHSSISAHGSGWALSFFWTLSLKTFHLGTVCVSLAWSSPLPRYCFCVDCLYCDLDTWYCIVFSSWNWKLEIHRIWNTEYTVSLVASVSFTMCSGGQDGYSFIPRWNEEAAALESFDQRVKLFVSSTKKEERNLCGPRLLATFDPEGDTSRYVRDNLTDVQLEAADWSGALMTVTTLRLSVGSMSIQEGVRLLLDFFRLGSLRRNYGETMRHWTRRLTLQYSKVGQALNASNAEINKDFLHENIRGILLAETSGLTSSEFASVLATSGTTGAEGESIDWQQLEVSTSGRSLLYTVEWCCRGSERSQGPEIWSCLSPEASRGQKETRNMDNKIPPPRLLGTGMQAGGSPILSTRLKDGMTTDSTGQPVPWWFDIYLRKESQHAENSEFLLWINRLQLTAVYCHRRGV